MTTYTSRKLMVDGMQTNIVEQGSGPSVVLLHSGEYGACAEGSWSELIPHLAENGYHVVAPDWLGFGETDKVVDFADPAGRRLRHMAATIKALDLGPTAFVGNSMGGTYLASAIASTTPLFDAAAAVLVSGGGFVPPTDARDQIQEYDLTEEGMARIFRAVTYHPTLADDVDWIRWRHQQSLAPGAWQCAASARLRPPGATERIVGVGKADDTKYEEIACPTLIIAGADDPLRLPNYADELLERIPDAELITYAECGHVPHLEYPERFREDLLEFLDRKFRKGIE